jgi:hypothetical protein
MGDDNPNNDSSVSLFFFYRSESGRICKRKSTPFDLVRFVNNTPDFIPNNCTMMARCQEQKRNKGNELVSAKKWCLHYVPECSSTLRDFSRCWESVTEQLAGSAGRFLFIISMSSRIFRVSGDFTTLACLVTWEEKQGQWSGFRQEMMFTLCTRVS